MSAKDQATEERTFTQDQVNDIVQDRLARDRQTRAEVVDEPRVYALDSPHSYFKDAANARMPNDYGARDRLARYGREIAYELDQRTREGKYVEATIRANARSNDPAEHRGQYKRHMQELRALVTGGGNTAAAASSASVFVSPFFAVDAWVPYRGIARAFADQCEQMPLPPFGGQVYVPYFSTTDSAAQLTEGSGVSETDPTTALQTSTVVNVAGQITMSQNMFDLAATGGGTFDTIMYRQLCQQLEEKVDLYAITSALSVGTVTAGSSSAGTGLTNFLLDQANTREAMTDTAGVRLRPAFLFSTTDQYSFWTKQVVTATGVPLFTPILQFPAYPPQKAWMTGADDGMNGPGVSPQWSRFTGTLLPQNVAWFTDDNIPASGSNSQLIMLADESVILFEDPTPIVTVFPQTSASNLEVILNARKYCAFLARHTAGIQILNSAAYPTSNH